MIDGKSYFDEPVKKNFRIYDNTEKKCDQSKIIQLVVYQITTIFINTRKWQQQIQVNKKHLMLIQQINVTRNLYGDGNANTAVIFIIVQAKEIILDFL